MPNPDWIVDRPWSHAVPTDRPLKKSDIKAHVALFPHMSNDYPVPLVSPIAGHQARGALPYLIPRKDRTSRLILAWAFKAPLIVLKELSLDLPQAGVRQYDPQVQAAVSFAHLDFIYQIEAWNEWFNVLPGESQAADGASFLVLRVQPNRVFVAPMDAPVHAFSPDLADFPGN